jgi:diketogulonate reductase-like aldo/keto reductase
MALNFLTSKVKLNSGNFIPLLGLGTYSLKGKTCEDAVSAALKVGYRHIDTGSIFQN